MDDEAQLEQVRDKAMNPYYEDDAVTIYHGDCRDIIPQLSYNALITDPPYGIAFRSNCRVATDKFDAIVGDGVVDVEWLKLVTEANVLVVFTRWDVLEPWRLALQSVAKLRGCIVWEKGGGGIGDLERSYGLDYELALYAATDEWHIPDKRHGSVWRNKKDAAGSYRHPTQKPVGIMETFVSRFTKDHNIVLDPFIGSGTTLVAAKNLGRKAIGIEIEERYCEIAAQRCSQEVLAL